VHAVEAPLLRGRAAGAAPVKYCDKMDVAEGRLPFRLDTESRLGCELVFTFSQRLPFVDFEPGMSCVVGQYLQFSSRFKLLCE
jgi:hypothetical protein